MHKFKVSQIWILAFFLAVVIAGCGDSDKNAGNPNFTAPTVLSASVLPQSGSSGICPNTVVTAIFSKAMNPRTINSPATTFTLTSSGGSVTGTVTYDSSTDTATFTPGALLTVSTTYTATITTGAADTFGNTLAANFTWSFTTAAAACSSPVPLLTAGNFKVLAGSTVTSTTTPPGTTITGGDLGLSPGTSVTGFPPGTVTPPHVMHVADPTAAQAQLDLTAAYNFAKGLASNGVLAGDLAGLTLTPGVYTTSSTTMISVGGTLHLSGTASDVFVFQIGSTLTTLSGTQVILSGGVLPSNVFWQVGSSATLGTNSIFVGNIMALASITLDTGASLQGRALARNGAVTLDDNTIFDP